MNIRILLLFFVFTLYLTCLPLCNNFFFHKNKILSKIYNKSFGSGTLLTSHSLLIYPPTPPPPQAHTLNTSIKIDIRAYKVHFLSQLLIGYLFFFKILCFKKEDCTSMRLISQ